MSRREKSRAARERVVLEQLLELQRVNPAIFADGLELLARGVAKAEARKVPA